jgi:leucyl aminopeptidase
MKLATLSVLAWSTSLVSTRFVEKQEADQVVMSNPTAEPEARYLIEFANGQKQWVTDAEKWKLKTVYMPLSHPDPISNGIQDGKFFMDTTNYRDLGNFGSKAVRKSQYPGGVSLQSKVNPLLQGLNKTYIQSHLEYLTSFHNRWYNSTYGEASYHWLFSTILNTIASSGADKYGIKAEPFIHPWGQNSIVVTIPGKTSSTIVVGAHQDSVNHADPVNGRAPGADDDGSGTVTILEVLRVMLSSKDLLERKAENTIQFHWYAGEEGGLLGSQALFLDYARSGKDIKAMLQQDMTGFYNATIEKHKEFGLMMDVGALDLP